MNFLVELNSASQIPSRRGEGQSPTERCMYVCEQQISQCKHSTLNSADEPLSVVRKVSHEWLHAGNAEGGRLFYFSQKCAAHAKLQLNHRNFAPSRTRLGTHKKKSQTRRRCGCNSKAVGCMTQCVCTWAKLSTCAQRFIFGRVWRTPKFIKLSRAAFEGGKCAAFVDHAATFCWPIAPNDCY